MFDRDDSYGDTLVVITGDHGEELLEHGLIGHGRSLSQDVLHVPLYVRPPRGTEGRTIASPVSLLDVVPTILELTGLPPLRTDGVSLAPQVEGRETTLPARPSFHHTSLVQPFSSRAIVDGRYKLVERRRGNFLLPRRLYDLSLDPDELEDRSDQGPEIADRLARVLGEAFLGFTNEVQAAGHYKVQWDGRSDTGYKAASGFYVYRLEAGAHVAARKMLLSK